MFRWLDLLLLFCFIKYRGSPPAPVTGNRGGDVILSCDFEAREVSHIDFNSLSKNILACQNEECMSENGRVFKEGSCDIIIKDLTLRDAGKYILSVHYTDDQTEVERLILKYHLHIQDEISVNTGEELKMDVLLANAEKVEHQSNTEWTEVWTRGHGVSSDRLTISDGNLTINAFTSTDTGTYRVLDSEGEIWITVTVTESVGLEQHSINYWILGQILFEALFGALFLALILALIIYVRRGLVPECPFAPLRTEGDGPDPDTTCNFLLQTSAAADSAPDCF